MKLETSTRATILIHYYRAMVGRADIWRMRMDTTTHWAIGATAAVLSFALGNAEAPHYVVHIGAFLTVIFLLLEARRLTFYHLWQQRVLAMERALIKPAVGSEDPLPAELAALERELLPDLGTTIPEMSLGKAAARRLRRVYLSLFAVQLLAWALKLATQPEPAGSLAGAVDRAALGPAPGTLVVGLTLLAFGLAAGLAMVRGGLSRRPEPPARAAAP